MANEWSIVLKLKRNEEKNIEALYQIIQNPKNEGLFPQLAYRSPWLLADQAFKEFVNLGLYNPVKKFDKNTVISMLETILIAISEEKLLTLEQAMEKVRVVFDGAKQD